MLENKIFWIRKCFRILNNPILEVDCKTILLSDCEIEFKQSPFTIRSHYHEHYHSSMQNFAGALRVKGYTVLIAKSDKEVVQYLAGKEVHYDDLPGSNEIWLLSRIDAKLIPYRHINYLLDEAIVPAKSGFSRFRKKYEKLALRKVNDTPVEQSLKDFQSYLDSGNALNYFDTRNAMTGDQFSTRLSHILNLGLASPKSILQLVHKYESEVKSNKSTYWIQFELLWREYFYWLYLTHEEDFFRSEGLDGGHFDLPELKESDFLKEMNTHPLITAMNRELTQTGFLSNRARQIYVSYLIHHTDLDWRYGAWFFQHHLTDYDLYSNWGNWLYGSGYGTDSRGPRYFKISKQLENYDPQGVYLKRWG